MSATEKQGEAKASFNSEKVQIYQGDLDTDLWVSGRVVEHPGIQFQAKVYDAGSTHGIHLGRISKLHVYDLDAGGKMLFAYDRGWPEDHRGVPDMPTFGREHDILHAIVDGFPEPQRSLIDHGQDNTPKIAFAYDPEKIRLCDGYPDGVLVEGNVLDGKYIFKAAVNEVGTADGIEGSRVFKFWVSENVNEPPILNYHQGWETCPVSQKVLEPTSELEHEIVRAIVDGLSEDAPIQYLDPPAPQLELEDELEL